MRLIYAAVAIGVLASLAGPALAQQDNQPPAPADNAGGQLGNFNDQTGSPTTGGESGSTFPDSTAIPQPMFPDPAAIGDTSPDGASADGTTADDGEQPQ